MKSGIQIQWLLGFLVVSLATGCGKNTTAQGKNSFEPAPEESTVSSNLDTSGRASLLSSGTIQYTSVSLDKAGTLPIYGRVTIGSDGSVKGHGFYLYGGRVYPSYLVLYLPIGTATPVSTITQYSNYSLIPYASVTKVSALGKYNVAWNPTYGGLNYNCTVNTAAGTFTGPYCFRFSLGGAFIKGTVDSVFMAEEMSYSYKSVALSVPFSR